RVDRRRTRAERSRTLVPARASVGARRPRRRPPHHPMTSWLTTILIFLPVAGALLVWVAPLPRFAAGSFAALVSLIEVGIWITSIGKFDFGSPGLQLDQRRSWFSD